MKKLSIIIPAYNAESFLDKCLNSCLKQDLHENDYEIIVVDDGSTDHTKTIVGTFQTSHPNIIYIYQNNAKQGAARNNGLRHAKGKYIWYIDADDWIKENCLNIIFQTLENKELEGVAVGHATVCTERIKIWQKFDKEIVASGKELLSNGLFLISPTYTIWKREYLLENQLFYKEHIFHEDSELCPRMYYHAKRLSFINETIYFVYQNPNSTTRGINPQRAFDIIEVVNSISLFSKTVNNKKILTTLNNYISEAINSSLYNTYHFNSDQRSSLDSCWYQQKQLFQHLLKSSILKYRIEGWLFKLFPHCISTVYLLMQKINTAPGGFKNNKNKSHIHE